MCSSDLIEELRRRRKEDQEEEGVLLDIRSEERRVGKECVP
nr:hypothetical protein [Streptococcus mitis]